MINSILNVYYMIDYDIKNMIVYKLTKILDAVSCTLMTN